MVSLPMASCRFLNGCGEVSGIKPDLQRTRLSGIKPDLQKAHHESPYRAISFRNSSLVLVFERRPSMVSAASSILRGTSARRKK